MKTSTAIASTSIVGLGLATLGAMPAQAADVTDSCASVTDHELSQLGIADNWYMDCVPQFGLGKVEFTINSDVDFPPGFVPLNDPSVTSTSANTGPAASTYFESTSGIAGFTALDEDSASPTQRTYSGSMMFVISGVKSIPVSELPAACGAGPYTSAYQVDYLPATVTFTQTIDGTVWTTVVHYTPSPLYLGLTFTDVPIDFAQDAPVCASSTTGTVVGAPFSTDWIVVVLHNAMAVDNGDVWRASNAPFPRSSVSDASPYAPIGEFAVTVPRPELAATGVDGTGLGLAGGLSILAGSLLAFFWRRRRGREQA